MTAARQDAGLTLVELLVTVAISALIMPVLGAAMVIGYRTTDATVASLEDTRDRQIVPSLFAADVQSATSVNEGSAGGCPLGGGTLVLRLSRKETLPGGTVVNRDAAWVTRTSAGTKLLERRACDDSGGAMALAGQVTTAHGVVGTPAVTCWDATAALIDPCTSISVAKVDLDVADASGAFTVTAGRRAAQ